MKLFTRKVQWSKAFADEKIQWKNVKFTRYQTLERCLCLNRNIQLLTIYILNQSNSPVQFESAIYNLGNVSTDEDSKPPSHNALPMMTET